MIMARRAVGGPRAAAAHRIDDGMVTAELALALPALVLILVAALAGLSLAVDDVRCVDAARAAARSAARGDTAAESIAIAHRLAPSGSLVRVISEGQLVRVVVTGPARAAAGLLPRLPQVSATATGDVEQAVLP